MLEPILYRFSNLKKICVKKTENISRKVFSGFLYNKFIFVIREPK